MRVLLLAGAAIVSLPLMSTLASAQSTSADSLNAQSTPAPASTTVVPSGDPAAPAAVVTDYPGNADSVPPTSPNKTYPVCTAKLQDNCQNRGEGGAPGRSRALGYWPGKPASEGGN